MQMDKVKEALITQIKEKIEDSWEDIETDLSKVGIDLKICLNLNAVRSGDDVAFLGKLQGKLPCTHDYALFDFNVSLGHDMLRDGTKLKDENGMPPEPDAIPDATAIDKGKKPDVNKTPDPTADGKGKKAPPEKEKKPDAK